MKSDLGLVTRLKNHLLHIKFGPFAHAFYLSPSRASESSLYASNTDTNLKIQGK
jgi:hypothetical protein